MMQHFAGIDIAAVIRGQRYQAFNCLNISQPLVGNFAATSYRLALAGRYHGVPHNNFGGAAIQYTVIV